MQQKLKGHFPQKNIKEFLKTSSAADLERPIEAVAWHIDYD